MFRYYAIAALLIATAGMIQVVAQDSSWRGRQQAAVVQSDASFTTPTSDVSYDTVQLDDAASAQPFSNTVEKQHREHQQYHKALSKASTTMTDTRQDDERRHPKEVSDNRNNRKPDVQRDETKEHTDEHKAKSETKNTAKDKTKHEAEPDDSHNKNHTRTLPAEVRSPIVVEIDDPLQRRVETLRESLQLPSRPVKERRDVRGTNQQESVMKEVRKVKDVKEGAKASPDTRQADIAHTKDQKPLPPSYTATKGEGRGKESDKKRIQEKPLRVEKEEDSQQKEQERRERERVKEQEKVVVEVAKRAERLSEHIAKTEERIAQKLGVTPPPPPPVKQAVREVLVDVARGALGPDEAKELVAKRLVEAGKFTSAEEAQQVSQRLVQREIAQEVRAAAEEIALIRRELIRSPAQELLADSDGDGLSDFEEKVLWGTDPNDAYTADDVLSDAERVLLGLDPLSTSTQPVPVASPREEGTVLPFVLEVSRVAAVPLAEPPSRPKTPATSTLSLSGQREYTPGHTAASTLEEDASSPTTVASSTVGLVLEGRAIPNTTAWLYIFSTPIVVAVRTDETGVWRYTLRRELPDGEHEAYVAIVNASGAIIAKSPPTRFVKTAQAVTYIPPTVVEEEPVSDRTFLDTLRDSVWGFALVSFGVIGLLALLVIGLWRMRVERGERPQ